MCQVVVAQFYIIMREKMSMATYYVNDNAQSNGDHEVHTSTCSFVPSVANRTYLGVFDNCKDAVKEAKKKYTKTNGCKSCSNECHTS